MWYFACNEQENVRRKKKNQLKLDIIEHDNNLVRQTQLLSTNLIW